MELAITVIGGALASYVVHWGFQTFSEHRDKPLVQIHWWWVTVIDADKLALSRFVVAGTTRALGTSQQRYHSESWVAGMGTYIKNPNVHVTEDLFINPAFPISDEGLADGIRVLRVRMQNTSRSRVVVPEHLGRVRFTILTSNRYALGWRFDRMATWPLPPFGEVGVSPHRIANELVFPHGLAPRLWMEDDFTVGYRPNRDAPPKVTVERTSSEIRLRVKPWEPSAKRPPWVVPYRIVRWLRKARRPALYVSTTPT
jgi:hypothetical protein